MTRAHGCASFCLLALLVSVLMMWQGTQMTYEGAARATTVEGAGADDRARCHRGCGHHQGVGHERRRLLRSELDPPFENPTPLSNFVETWSITIIPMSMVVMLG